MWSPVVSSLVALGSFVFPPFGFFFGVCFGSECSNVLLMGLHVFYWIVLDLSGFGLIRVF